MVVVERGKIEAGQIVFPEPLSLPEGTEVTVRIETAPTSGETATADADFASLPFFGMWADREEMQDSVAWVEKERRQWQQRNTRED